jgi:hypothetical protein
MVSIKKAPLGGLPHFGYKHSPKEADYEAGRNHSGCKPDAVSLCEKYNYNR